MIQIQLFRLLITAALVAGLVFGQATPNLNRLVSVQVTSHVTNDGELVFIDADTLQVDTYPLPAGFIPGVLVAMDRNGDVWMNRFLSDLLYKFSGVDGSLMAVVTPPLPITAITTNRLGHLVAATTGPLGAGIQQSAYLYEYDGNGNLVRSLDVRTLFPPGGFAGFDVGTNIDHFGGVRNLIMEPNGGIWFTVHSAIASPVIKLDQNWNLVASYGVYFPHNMRPDSDGGVWISHRTSDMISTYNTNAQVLPGLLGFGWVHLDAQGNILESVPDCAFCWWFPGRIREDGRQFLAFGSNDVKVRLAGTTGGPFFPLGPRIPLPQTAQSVFMNLELDGSQHVWTRRSASGFGPMTWHRSSLEAPYLGPREVDVLLGEAWGVNVGNPQAFCSLGETSLFRYCKSTDPFGDLDGDGVPNLEELRAFSNPLVPFGVSSRPTASVAFDPMGSSVSVTWSVPGDLGLAYAAPFGLSVSIENLGGGSFLPLSLQDGLVQASLFGHPALSNTIGFLDLQGMTSVSASLPTTPSLTGLPISTFIATWDPGLPTLFETVSYPITFTLP